MQTNNHLYDHSTVGCPCSGPWWGINPPPCTCGRHYIAHPVTPYVPKTATTNDELARKLRELADLLDGSRR